ncbi:MAG: tRNA pseudouridine(38-40) synthase TruA [Actinomycetota bacterium]
MPRGPPAAKRASRTRSRALNVRLDLAYDGSFFHGFARQPDVKTVQGEVETALSQLFGHEVFTVGAGRTDAGVHALGQVMSTTDAPDDADLNKARDALNAMCGPSIAVSACVRVSDDFHARFSARSRTYVYAILDGEVPDPFLSATTLHHSRPLDVDAMVEAAGYLLGAHDFTSFGRLTEPEASAERTLFELACRREGRIVRVRARADAFIQQMVRSLVGTLIQVGEGRRSPDEMPAVISARDRSAAGPVVPPHGLCLVSVEYDDGWSSPNPVI